MTPISFKRHRFSPVIIQHVVWLYARLTLSFRDVEELLAERGIDVSNETVRRWFLKFGRLMAVSEQNLEYLRWRRTTRIDAKKSREINGGEMRLWRSGKVIKFTLTTP